MSNLARSLKTVERALYAPYHQGYESNLMRGKLDPRRAFKAVQGNPYFFRRKDVREERRSALSMTLDFSSSMHDEDKPNSLDKMVNGLGDLCELNRVAWEVNGFSTMSHYVQDAEGGYSYDDTGYLHVGGFNSETQEHEQFAFKARRLMENEENTRRFVEQSEAMNRVIGRGTSTDEHEFRHNYTADYRKRISRGDVRDMSAGTCVRLKSFERPPNRKILENIRGFISGGTNDAHVYRQSVRRTAEREEGTKIALYLGDGAGDGMPYIRAITNEARTLGVITVGIGLGRGARECVNADSFDAHVQVDDVESLDVKAFDLLTAGIVRRRDDILSGAR